MMMMIISVKQLVCCASNTVESETRRITGWTRSTELVELRDIRPDNQFCDVYYRLHVASSDTPLGSQHWLVLSVALIPTDLAVTVTASGIRKWSPFIGDPLTFRSD